MTFSSLALPPELRRQSVLAEKYRPEGYLDNFDAETLWYDAIWDRGLLSLICPPLNNLRKKVRTARFRGDGQPLRLKKVRRFKRHVVLEFPAPRCPSVLSVYIDTWRGESGVSRADHNSFSGRNVVFYFNKNNDLKWLAHHAQYYVKLHGVDTVVVIDNNSSRYDVAGIEDAVASAGVTAHVLPAPFRFGPLGLAPYRRTEKYLQTAVYNILRLRFLGKARAVLCADVDELILTDGPSIFDAAKASRLGFVQIAGQWHSPPPGHTAPFTHADHIYVDDPPRTCPPKWCVVPDGPLRGWSWDIHGMERLPILHGRTHPDFLIAHCLGINTGWKKTSRLQARDGTLRDDLAARCFEKVPWES